MEKEAEKVIILEDIIWILYMIQRELKMGF